MALALIALYAGGELKLKNLVEHKKSLIVIIFCQFLIVLGVTLVLFLTRANFSIFSNKTNIQIVGVAVLIGVVCVARSPATAIAIINETRSKGRVTDIVLGTTIALDVLIIILFAIAVSLCRVVFESSQAWDLHFFFILSTEIVISIIMGIFLGFILLRYMKHVHVILPIVLLTVGFLVVKFSYYLTDYLEHIHGIGLKIEPLLICITAGFVVQNFSCAYSPE